MYKPQEAVFRNSYYLSLGENTVCVYIAVERLFIVVMFVCVFFFSSDSFADTVTQKGVCLAVSLWIHHILLPSQQVRGQWEDNNLINSVENSIYSSANYKSPTVKSANC